MGQVESRPHPPGPPIVICPGVVEFQWANGVSPSSTSHYVLATDASDGFNAPSRAHRHPPFLKMPPEPIIASFIGQAASQPHQL